MSAFEDPYGSHYAERRARLGQALRHEVEFNCLYCMDLKVVWEPDIQDAPIDRWNPRREKPCPMCKKGKR